MEAALPCWLLGLVWRHRPCGPLAPGGHRECAPLPGSWKPASLFQPRVGLKPGMHSLPLGVRNIPCTLGWEHGGHCRAEHMGAGSKRRPGMCVGAAFAQPHRPISRCWRCWSRASSGPKGTAPAAKPAEDPSCCQGAAGVDDVLGWWPWPMPIRGVLEGKAVQSPPLAKDAALLPCLLLLQE